MQISGRILGSLSLLLGILTLVKSPPGIAGGVLWLPKLWAGAWAPAVALAGLLGALLGWLSRDYYGLLAGLLGSALGIRHVVIVTRQHDSFIQAFGADWEDRLSPEQKRRMWTRRYQLLQ